MPQEVHRHLEPPPPLVLVDIGPQVFGKRFAVDRVAQISLGALFEKKLSIIIFPEGNRSVQLSEGRNGIAQLALHSDKTVIPIGCNGSEAIYPSSSPFAKSGTITYRIGEPMTVHDHLEDFRIREKFQLFSKKSQEKYKEVFDAATRTIMKKIDMLLDERYRVTAQ